MPTAPRTICRHPGCFRVAEPGKHYCEKHAADETQREKLRQKAIDARRGSSTQRGYTYAWQRASKSFLKRHPLCAECMRQGRIKPAEVVDHIKPHKGDRELFWDRSNWQALCKECHDRKTATEDGGFGRRMGRGIQSENERSF